MAGEKSLLHITKPEIDFAPCSMSTTSVYEQAVKNFKEWQAKGWLGRDSKECYYVYAQSMESRTQYGLVLCAHTDDYAWQNQEARATQRQRERPHDSCASRMPI